MSKRQVLDYRLLPFLFTIEEVREFLKGAPLEQVISSSESPIRLRALNNLRKILSEGVPGDPELPLEYEVASYYALIMIAKSLAERRLYTRISVAYSKRARDVFNGLDEKILAGLGRKLGLDVELEKSPIKIPVSVKKGVVVYNTLSFSMGVKSYLSVVSQRLIQDKKYHISSTILDKGRVFLDRETFIRVLEEAVYQYILKSFDSIEPVGIDSGLLNESRRILEELGLRTGGQSLEEHPKEVREGAFPPCVKKVIERLRSGENISHPERFLLATFLINIGVDIDSIVELFRNAPDFNERITRYQVEHLAGLRGGKKKYLPYSCDKLKSLGICPITDKCPGDNPLSVYYKNLKGALKGQSNDRGNLSSENIDSVDEDGEEEKSEDDVA
ncbi:MAG: DNA primase [Thermogladius sp.]|nr:DNA primase [Thermogladius sp.]